jgi:hypothetical protein
LNEMTRRRSRMTLLAAAFLCAVSISASTAATATEYTPAPSWKAAPAHSAPAMPVMVAEVPAVALVAASSSLVVVLVPVDPVVAGSGNPIPSRPREKPRLRA